MCVYIIQYVYVFGMCMYVCRYVITMLCVGVCACVHYTLCRRDCEEKCKGFKH